MQFISSLNKISINNLIFHSKYNSAHLHYLFNQEITNNYNKKQQQQQKKELIINNNLKLF
jgi:hypothetical protein